MYKLSDFKKGQKVFVELTGNACRYKDENSLIEEWEVVSVGHKYVTATNPSNNITVKFMEHTLSYGGLIQVTDYCVDYVLYPTKEDIEAYFEREVLFSKISSAFYNNGVKNNNPFSLSQLRAVRDILEL